MFFKAICAFALIQVISCQAPCNTANPGLYGAGLANRGFNGINNLNGLNNGLNGLNGFNNGLNGLNNGLNGLNNGLNGLNNGLNGFNNGVNNALNGLNNCGVASTGGGFQVSSASPNAPTGVTVVSENAFEGPLSVGGNLPFLGSVALEGVLPTAGAGAINYGCGNGAVGIAAEEGPVATGIAPTAGAAPASYPGAVAGPAQVNAFNAYGRNRFGLNNCA